MNSTDLNYNTISTVYVQNEGQLIHEMTQLVVIREWQRRKGLGQKTMLKVCSKVLNKILEVGLGQALLENDGMLQNMNRWRVVDTEKVGRWYANYSVCKLGCDVENFEKQNSWERKFWEQMNEQGNVDLSTDCSMFESTTLETHEILSSAF